MKRKEHKKAKQGKSASEATQWTVLASASQRAQRHSTDTERTTLLTLFAFRRCGGPAEPNFICMPHGFWAGSGLALGSRSGNVRGETTLVVVIKDTKRSTQPNLENLLDRCSPLASNWSSQGTSCKAQMCGVGSQGE